MLDQEFHLNRSTGGEKHDVGLIGWKREVHIVLKHRQSWMLKDDGMALDVFDFEPHGIFAIGDAGFVGVGEIPDQPVVVQFEIVIVEIVVKHRVRPVWRVHDEVDFLDVVSSKGVTDLYGELHFPKFRAVVGGPLKLLRIVPVAAVFFMARVNANAGALLAITTILSCHVID